MRKNSYNKKILMVNSIDINRVFSSIEIVEDRDAANRLKFYSKLINAFLLEKSSNSPYIDSNKEFGILINSPITEKLEEIFTKVCSKEKVSLESILNAFLYSELFCQDEKIRENLHRALLERIEMTGEDFSKVYGEVTLEFLLAHKDYNYILNMDSIVQRDYEIMLCHDGVLEKVAITKEDSYIRKRNRK